MTDKPKELLSGGIYPNDRKEKDTQPDFTGPCSTPDGKKLRFAAWKAQDKNGKAYLSFKISEPMPQKEEQPAAAEPAPADDDFGF